jgi:precorrin-6Y C5,15-methyltransferase (decarboxylating)
MTASGAAAELLRFHPGSAVRPAAAAENLGMDTERIERGTLESLSKMSCGGLSVLLLLPGGTAPGLPLGLPDSSYEHGGRLITHPQARAVALSALRLRPGVLWDLGAGSGSVGIEAAGLCEFICVYAAEKSPERCRQITANAAAEGLASYFLREGDILKVTESFPDPDMVFIGGGGAELPQIVELCKKHLRPDGVIVAASVTLESAAALAPFLKAEPEAWEVVTLSVSVSENLAGSRLMRAENPVSFYIYTKLKIKSF